MINSKWFNAIQTSALILLLLATIAEDKWNFIGEIRCVALAVIFLLGLYRTYISYKGKKNAWNLFWIILYLISFLYTLYMLFFYTTI